MRLTIFTDANIWCGVCGAELLATQELPPLVTIKVYPCANCTLPRDYQPEPRVQSNPLLPGYTS